MEVIRIKDKGLAKVVTENVIEAGFKFIELTLTIENAHELISELNIKYDGKGGEAKKFYHKFQSACFFNNELVYF